MANALPASVHRSTSLPTFPRIPSPPLVVTKPCILPVKVQIESNMQFMIYPDRSPDGRVFRILSTDAPEVLSVSTTPKPVYLIHLREHRAQPPYALIWSRFRERSPEDGLEVAQFAQVASPYIKGSVIEVL
ncbi:hypothetical protein BDM02DRAFT_3191106 [Thelephora ganbajun]|uniref:Uncharacterized protein n=1 Tax=Thelephora ganbajun TaxID=370292 RepID=A0ACB6Z2X6_THEGA|nr:hypothetical protein BDM02DRAFT_3191106 [Thelephora ganbajun]